MPNLEGITVEAPMQTHPIAPLPIPLPPPDSDTPAHLEGNPTRALAATTWGFFVGFAAVALFGSAAQAFERQMQLSGLTLGILLAAPQLSGALLRIPFGAWVDRRGGRLPMLMLLGLS